jgi:hypothetical protein
VEIIRNRKCNLLSLRDLRGKGEARRGNLIFIGKNGKSAHEIATACTLPHPASLAMTIPRNDDSSVMTKESAE